MAQQQQHRRRHFPTLHSTSNNNYVQKRTVMLLCYSSVSLYYRASVGQQKRNLERKTCEKIEYTMANCCCSSSSSFTNIIWHCQYHSSRILSYRPKKEQQVASGMLLNNNASKSIKRKSPCSKFARFCLLPQNLLITFWTTMVLTSHISPVLSVTQSSPVLQHLSTGPSLSGNEGMQVY